MAASPHPHQRSFDDLGLALHDVTFCVVDLETTGGSPDECGITEIGAVKLRAGECLGTFQTLVNPGSAIPPAITVLTGITHQMVLPAPRVETVLPALLEFAGDAVLVGHNVRFDLAFLRAALERSGRPPLANRSVDTCALARRLVRDEVPNCKLGTLASRLRLAHQPSHRALDDALATGDLLHLLLERAAGLGVTGLDDLLALPTMAGSAHATKLSLTNGLPREPGVYLFLDRGGRALYVGKATNLRTRVRSYFSGDTRRKIGALLRETHSIDHIVCSHPLDAAVREVRLIHELAPRYNRQSKDWGRYAYLKLTLNELYPRLSVVRVARADGCFYLGPLPSARAAKRVSEAIHTALPLRRCTVRPGRIPTAVPCSAAQLGVAACPCAGTTSAAEYAQIVQRAIRGLTVEPQILLVPLRDRMEELARQKRFEEATDVRERAAALASALRRQRRFDALRRAGRIVVELPDRSGAELVSGRLISSWTDGVTVPLPLDQPDPTVEHGLDDLGHALPVARELADELTCVAQWIDREASRVRLVHCDDGLASLLPALPSFDPRSPRTSTSDGYGLDISSSRNRTLARARAR